MTQRKINGIIFDFDGTLANTTPLIFSSFDYATEKVLGQKADRGPYLETFGQPLRPSMIRLYGKENGEKICEAYRSYQEKHHDELLESFPGVKETLAALRERDLPLVIVTSRFYETCVHCLDTLGLHSYIKGIIGGDMITRYKPDPEPSLKGLELLGLPGEQVLAIGDTPYDLLSAREAGCHTAAVAYTVFGRENLLRLVTPDYWLDTMPDLLPLLDRLEQG